jgi:hypothetical protein
VSADNGVCGDEALYRRVPDRPGSLYVPIEGGGFRATSGAFGDKRGRPASEQQPSVDRAKLRDYDPYKSRKHPTDCVISFTAAAVREIAGFGTIDVVPDPNPPEDPDNASHALVVADPPFASKTQFDKFKQQMARVADSNWEIPPPSST